MTEDLILSKMISFFTSDEIKNRLLKLIAEDFELLNWQVSEFNYLSYTPATAKILEIKTEIRFIKTQLEEVCYLIVKIINSDTKDYKKVGGREIFVYENILPKHSPCPRIGWTRYLGSTTTPDGFTALWLEKLEGLPAENLRLEDWREFSMELARLQAEFLTISIPQDTQLNNNDLRNWVLNEQEKQFPNSLHKEAITHKYFSSDAIESIRWIWENRLSLLDLLDTLPQTLCHYDIWAGNLLKQPTVADGRYILLDWQLAGLGALGSDLAFAVLAQNWLLIGDASNPNEMAETMLDGYLEGLKSAGREDLVKMAETCFTVTATLRWGLMFPQFISHLENIENIKTSVLNAEAVSTTEILAARAALIKAGVNWSNRTREILAEKFS